MRDYQLIVLKAVELLGLIFASGFAFASTVAASPLIVTLLTISMFSAVRLMLVSKIQEYTSYTGETLGGDELSEEEAKNRRIDGLNNSNTAFSLYMLATTGIYINNALDTSIANVNENISNKAAAEEASKVADESKGIENGSKILGVDEMVVSDQKFLNTSGDIDWEKYAPNGGYIKDSILTGQTIETGTIIDRYGNQYGRYTSPVGVTYEQRALPYIENPNAYHQYEVLKPIDNVTIGIIAKAFNQIGGGLQYELPTSIKQLIEDGFLKEIKRWIF